MKKLLLFTAAALCLVGCNSDVKDYKVKGTYVSADSSQGFHEFIFLDDYVQVTFLFDSIDPELGQRVNMVSQCLYEQKKQNVTVYSAYYDVPPHEKDSDLHLVSYSDYIIHAGRRFNSLY